MADAPNQLGEAIIKVRVDDTGIGPGIATSVTTVKSAMNEQSVATDKTGDAIERLSDRLKHAAKPLRDMGELVGRTIGLFSLYSSTVGGIIGVLGYFAEKQKEATMRMRESYDAAKKFTEALTEMRSQSSVTKSLDQLTAEADAVDAKYEKMKQSARENEKLRGEQLQSTLRAIEAQRVVEGNALRQSIKDRIGVNEANTRGRVQFEIATQKELERIQKEADDKKQAEEDRRAEESYQRALDSAQRIADAVERAYSDALSNARNKAAGMFSGGTDNGVDLIVQKLEAIARNTKSRM